MIALCQRMGCFGLGAALLGLLLCQPSLAEAEAPRPDRYGNFGRTSHRFWVVVDDDREGLSCRWSPEMPEAWFSPAARLPEQSIGQWAVVRRFDYGTLLTANTTPAGSTMFLDMRGLPWLKVRLDENDTICLVRANSSFILPIE